MFRAKYFSAEHFETFFLTIFQGMGVLNFRQFFTTSTNSTQLPGPESQGVWVFSTFVDT